MQNDNQIINTKMYFACAQESLLHFCSSLKINPYVQNLDYCDTILLSLRNHETCKSVTQNCSSSAMCKLILNHNHIKL